MKKHHIATSKTKRKPYSKELKEHLYITKSGFPLITSSERKQLDKQDKANLERKAKLLFEHFEIPINHPNGWEIIALALASNHVFQIMPPNDGRPPTTSKKEALFYRYFLRKKGGRAIEDSQACLDLLRGKGLKDLEKYFPELATLSHKRLRNIISKARTARKKRGKTVCKVREIRNSGENISWILTPAERCLDDVSILYLKYSQHPKKG